MIRGWARRLATPIAILMLSCFGVLGTLWSQNPSYQSDPKWRAPAAAEAKRSPLAKKPGAAAGGKKLFQRNCVECHGDDGSGLEKKNIPPTCDSPSFNRRLTARCSGRSLTAILIEVCPHSAACPSRNAGNWCSTCEP